MSTARYSAFGELLATTLARHWDSERSPPSPEVGDYEVGVGGVPARRLYHTMSFGHQPSPQLRLRRRYSPRLSAEFCLIGRLASLSSPGPSPGPEVCLPPDPSPLGDRLLFAAGGLPCPPGGAEETRSRPLGSLAPLKVPSLFPRVHGRHRPVAPSAPS